MTHATALFAGIAAAVLIPSLIALYFLKLRRRDVEISTTLLWKKSIEDLQANAPFQKLRKNILLLLQLLALAAGLYALADPSFQSEAEGGQKHVILIDRSASMSALDGDPDQPGRMTRLERAKTEALRVIDGLRDPGLLSQRRGDEAMVIAFDSTAEVRQTFTSDKGQLRAAINAIEPSDALTKFKDAIALARAHAPKRTMEDRYIDAEGQEQVRIVEGPLGPVGTLHVFSDGALPDSAEASVHPQDVVSFVRVGAPDAGNVGITTLRATRDFANPTELSIFVGLENSTTVGRTVDVELIIDGVTAAIREANLAPAESAPVAEAPPDADDDEAPPAPPRPRPSSGGVEFEMSRSEGGVIAVQIVPGEDDMLPTDNTAWLVVPPAKQLNVALVTEGNLFARAALRSLPAQEFVEMTPTQYQQMAPSERDFDVVVLDGWLPTQGESAETAADLPPGRFIVLGAVPGGESRLTIVDSAIRSVIVSTKQHPVLHNLSFDAVMIFEQPIVDVGPDSPTDVLAQSTDGPAILEYTTADTRAIIVPFDVTNSSWGLDKSFLLFMAKAVRYLGEEDAAAVGRVVQPGEVYADRIPPSASGVRVRDPEGDEQSLAVAPDGQIVYGPVERVGVHRIQWEGGGRRAFAANLLDPTESDVRTADKIELAGGEYGAQTSGAARSVVRLWPWLLLAALAIMLFEWYIYNRKVQV